MYNAFTSFGVLSPHSGYTRTQSKTNTEITCLASHTDNNGPSEMIEINATTIVLLRNKLMN